MTTTIMFTGHRDAEISDGSLALIHSQFPDSVWIHGGAIGFDTQVEEFATERNIPTIVYKPNYDLYGEKAPLRRNDQMLKQAQIIVALWDGRKSGETYYVVTRAEQIGLPVIRMTRKN